MKIYLDSIGCRLNQSEIESYAIQLRNHGHAIIDNPDEADLAILNTCAVTSAASSDSRQKLRKVHHAGANHIVITGCWSTLFPDEVKQLFDTSQIISNQDKDRLVSILFPESQEIFDLEPINRFPIPGPRFRTRAFIKVQDGCNNHCTFCITAIARGRGRSRPIQDIHSDLQKNYLTNSNSFPATNEIALTGVHLGSWGQDLDPPLHLRDLIQSILDNFDIPRLRLSSLEPWDLDANFFKLWKDPRLCRHLHLPLQSGSRSTLQRMARKTTPQRFAALVEQAREAIPELAITTDLIAGFPGESDTEFAETTQFVRQQCFAGGHVFTYSPRPGTAATRLPNQVPYPIRKERNARLRQIIEDSAQTYCSQFLGQKVNVLWENTTAIGPEGWRLSGLTDTFIRIYATSPHPIWNQFTLVRVTGQTEKGLEGEIVTPKL